MTVMKVHQKYFAVYDASHLIQPYFVFVSNMPTKTSRDKNTILGNEKFLDKVTRCKIFGKVTDQKRFLACLKT